MDSFNKTRNIIFDLGQVIVSVNEKHIYSALEKINPAKQNITDIIFKHQDFKLFELGKLSEQDFFSRLSQLLLIDDSKLSHIVDAWNAMIVDIPIEGLHLLKKLKNHFSLFALSNTNVSHIHTINRLLMNNFKIRDVKELFHHVYYSCEIGLRKPDPKIFQHVLSQQNLLPKHTLFIDDNIENIAAARNVGLQTIHLTEQKKLADELNKHGII